MYSSHSSSSSNDENANQINPTGSYNQSGNFYIKDILTPLPHDPQHLRQSHPQYPINQQQCQHQQQMNPGTNEESEFSNDNDENEGKKAKKKTRKDRTSYTNEQLMALEESFERTKYLSIEDRLELATKLNLSDTQLKTWYQNRRTKWKRKETVGLELLAEGNNYAAVKKMLETDPNWINRITNRLPSKALEKSFERSKYPSLKDRMELAAKLNLSETQVRAWYQNRRNKGTRPEAVGLELLADADNCAAVKEMLETNPNWMNRVTNMLPQQPTPLDLYHRRAAMIPPTIYPNFFSSPIPSGQQIHSFLPSSSSTSRDPSQAN